MTDLERAVTLHRAGDLASAAQAYRAIIAAQPNPTAMGNLGSILRTEGRVEEAEALLRSAVELEPQRTPARLNLANLLYRSGRLGEAAAEYSEVIRIDPNHAQALRDLGNVYLALGRDADGWALYDHRPERVNSKGRGLSFPEWRGEPLSGKQLLVLCEQGMGDNIFAARYLPGLDAAQVTLACPPELCRLFSQLSVKAIPWREEVLAVERHDFWTTMLSLPRWCAAASVPYLAGAPRRTGGLGIAWRGNALPDPGRSLPADLAAELLSLPGAISLHPEDSGAGDFQDTADIIAGLDLVISIDTSVAHLAGAMGKPTIVLLQHAVPDWRWRDRPPWYPTVEILRQPKPGDWTPLIDEVKRLARQGR